MSPERNTLIDGPDWVRWSVHAPQVASLNLVNFWFCPCGQSNSHIPVADRNELLGLLFSPKQIVSFKVSDCSARQRANRPFYAARPAMTQEPYMITRPERTHNFNTMFFGTHSMTISFKPCLQVTTLLTIDKIPLWKQGCVKNSVDWFAGFRCKQTFFFRLQYKIKRSDRIVK